MQFGPLGCGDGLFLEGGTRHSKYGVSMQTALLFRLEFSCTLQAFHCYLISHSFLIVNLSQTIREINF